MKLRRYWIEFDPTDRDRLPIGVAIGCGVTAFAFEDAIGLIKERVFGHEDLPKIDQIIEDVDVSTLDQGHVIPNMLPPVYRGIWYPGGYQ